MSTLIYTFTRFKKYSLILIALGIATSCNLIFDEGEWKTELRVVSEYEKVSVECVCEVYFHYNETYKIEVHYYDKHLSDITTKVSKGELTISNNPSNQNYNSHKNPEIHLYAPTLKSIKVEEEFGAGFFSYDAIINSRLNIEVNSDLIELDMTINVDSLFIDVNNSAGLIELEGLAGRSTIVNNGEATIKAKNLSIQQLNIRHQSSVDAEFTVNERLSYRILRSGDLIIWGNPQHSGETLGSGNLVLK
jgi:hypothetical protein